MRVHAGRDSATGRSAYVSRTVRGDRDAAERGLVALVAQVSDSPTSPTFGTVGELCDKWWKYSSPNLSPTVAREYRRLIDRRLVPTLGHVKVADLRASQLDAWYSELLASGAVSGRPLSANSALAITSWYQRGKSSARGVRIGALAGLSGLAIRVGSYPPRTQTQTRWAAAPSRRASPWSESARPGFHCRSHRRPGPRAGAGDLCGPRAPPPPCPPGPGPPPPRVRG